MRLEPAAQGAARSPARPADKGANTEAIDAAILRRAIDGVTAVTGCRRKAARERVRSWISGGMSRTDLEAWLWQNFRLDPTGVTAVRNVSRERGVRNV